MKIIIESLARDGVSNVNDLFVEEQDYSVNCSLYYTF